MDVYYNTTSVTQPQLGLFQQKAMTQEQNIMALFRAKRLEAGPSQVHAMLYGGNGTPITSVRRAMTNLAKSGQLEKLDRKITGEYGRPEHVWRLP